ncbi:MAG: hypothetical protein EOP38_05295 [Rubrivivax sp.]|nr:MAG: hypothetical protein EOP38_05295 [Rubrivivax sp.]
MAQRTLHAAQILWPAFMVAGVLEMVVFSSVDPSSLHLGQWQPDVNTVYSLAFFVFWTLVAFASSTSHWLMVAVQPAPVRRRLRRHRI